MLMLQLLDDTTNILSQESICGWVENAVRVLTETYEYHVHSLIKLPFL